VHFWLLQQLLVIQFKSRSFNPTLDNNLAHLLAYDKLLNDKGYLTFPKKDSLIAVAF